MFVVVEPAEFFMHRVKLIFDLESPDLEDAEAKGILWKSTSWNPGTSSTTNWRVANAR